MKDQAPLCEAALHGVDTTGLHAHWIKADDGVRLRLLHGAGNGLATIAIFPGRAEFAEKYVALANQLRRHGYDVAIMDWRGQGLSDRLTDDSRLGHVGDFLDYQRDVDAVLNALRTLPLAAPHFLLAHSMGGAIGMRTLLRGRGVEAAAFLAPMWGLATGAMPKWLFNLTAQAAVRIGLQCRYAPSQRSAHYIETARFAGNVLTSDRPSYAIMREQLIRCPELAIGGASYGWVRAATAELASLMHAGAPTCPTLVMWGSCERVVDPQAIRRRLADWPTATGQLIDGGRHELLFEAQPIRDAVFDHLVTFFARHTPPRN